MWAKTMRWRKRPINWTTTAASTPGSITTSRASRRRSGSRKASPCWNGNASRSAAARTRPLSIDCVGWDGRSSCVVCQVVVLKRGMTDDKRRSSVLHLPCQAQDGGSDRVEGVGEALLVARRYIDSGSLTGVIPSRTLVVGHSLQQTVVTAAVSRVPDGVDRGVHVPGGITRPACQIGIDTDVLGCTVHGIPDCQPPVIVVCHLSLKQCRPGVNRADAAAGNMGIGVW